MSPTIFPRIDLVSVALGAAIAVVWFFVGGLLPAVSVATGTALALLNFMALRFLVGKLFGQQADAESDDGTRGLWGVLFAFKFGFLAALIFVAVAVLRLDGVALAVGMSAVVLAIFSESARGLLTAPAANQETPQR